MERIVVSLIRSHGFESASTHTVGPSDYNQRNNIKSTTIRQRRKPTVEPAQHAIDDDRGAHIFRTV